MCVGVGDVLGLPTIEPKNPSSDWGFIILEVFTGLDEMYFMQLFFFISGFFVPRSFDKKGSVVFLQERIKRLGIPPVVYTFCIGPYVQTGLANLFFDNLYTRNGADTFGQAIPLTNSGVTWFPEQLIFFGIIYVFACRKNWMPKMECPTVFGFFLISLMIGTVTGIIALFFPIWDEFFRTPLFFQNYFSYILFFFGGAIAQRNNWMDDIKAKRSRIAIYTWMILASLFMVLFILVIPILGYSINPLVFTYDSSLLGFIWVFSTKGPVLMGLSLGIIAFFMDYVNRSYWYTQFFSVSMYTAYIIQPVVIACTVWFWVLVLKATNNLDVGSQDGTGTYSYTNGNLIVPGFIFVSMLTLIIIWPLSYGIRSIPGFSKVL